ncbi:MAG TPA: GW dipeptide domain-containing protein, partial [Virgibacillus sp.]
MRKTAILLIVLLTFGLISPSLSLAASENAVPHAINQQADDKGEEQDGVSVEPSEEDLLGHIREESVKVYQDLNDLSVSEEAGRTYMNQVYYIENQAKIEDQLYYLISSKIDDESAEVGWVESEGVITQPFTTIDKPEETLFISGSGEAYQNPWGGEDDIVYDLAAFENKDFEIDLTQKVGEDIWYQGILDDETVWIQSNHLKTEEASNDSKDNENAESDKQVGDDNGANEPEKSDEVKDEEQQNDEETEDEIEKEHQDDGKLEADEADANHTTSEKALLKRSIASRVQESKTSKLGHIRSTNVDIYKNINNLSSSKKAGDKYTHAVYYIKKQANVNGQVYYLISKEPSSTKGVVGWVKSQDLSTHAHVSVDKKSKTFYVKGTGKAYDTAWGGNKNLVYNLSKYKNQVFKVHLTEKVGNNTWYRGTLNGKTVWIHESYLGSVKESKTSKLSHIRSAKVQIYKTIGDASTAITAGDKYTHAVYYIKKQAKVNSQVYYLISKSPSSTKGVVGWVKSQDLSTHPHVGVDKKSKTFYIKGTGNAYDTAWGGKKNLVYKLSQYKGQAFKVHLTEKVGNNT